MTFLYNYLFKYIYYKNYLIIYYKVGRIQKIILRGPEYIKLNKKKIGP
jgi:hypothetical protein